MSRSNQPAPGGTRHVALAVCRVGGVGAAIAACSFSITAPQADAADRLVAVQLTPAGEFTPSDGREMKVPAWRIDAGIAARVIERFKARTNPPVLDYEHQTLRTEENGQPAPAGGWIRSLEWRDGSGLWAQVELTKRAAQFVSDGEYRYISPVFVYDAETGDVLAITMAALTNDPAIDGMAPLEARAVATSGFSASNSSLEQSMNKLHLALCALLGLAADKTTEDQAVAACNALKPRLDALEKIRAETGAEEIKDEASAAAAVAACTALKKKAEAAGTGDGTPDPSKYVPVGVVESIKGELASLKADLNGRDVEGLVADGLKDGRLLDAQKDWATELGKKDIAALRGYLASAQPIAALSGTQTGGRQPAGGQDENGLTHDELAICKATGTDPKDFAASKKQQASA